MIRLAVSGVPGPMPRGFPYDTVLAERASQGTVDAILGVLGEVDGHESQQIGDVVLGEGSAVGRARL